MRISKVLKKMKENGTISGPISNPKKGKYVTSRQRGKSGFQAKQNSEEGALRQRSMGNRNTKPGR